MLKIELKICHLVILSWSILFSERVELTPYKDLEAEGRS